MSNVTIQGKNSTAESNGSRRTAEVYVTSGALHVTTSDTGTSTATTLESFVVAGGASQTGTPVALTAGDRQVTFAANGSSGAFTATGVVMYSDDGTNYFEASRTVLSGTATTAEGDSLPFNGDHLWIRIDVESFTGTGATLSAIMVN